MNKVALNLYYFLTFNKSSGANSLFIESVLPRLDSATDRQSIMSSTKLIALI